MKATDTVEIMVLDKDGFELSVFNNFDSIKAARERFKYISTCRDYWVHYSESIHFPSTIDTIQLIKNGEVIKDAFPKW